MGSVNGPSLLKQSKANKVLCSFIGISESCLILCSGKAVTPAIYFMLNHNEGDPMKTLLLLLISITILLSPTSSLCENSYLTSYDMLLRAHLIAMLKGRIPEHSNFTPPDDEQAFSTISMMISDNLRFGMNVAPESERVFGIDLAYDSEDANTMPLDVFALLVGAFLYSHENNDTNDSLITQWEQLGNDKLQPFSQMKLSQSMYYEDQYRMYWLRYLDVVQKWYLSIELL